MELLTFLLLKKKKNEISYPRFPRADTTDGRQEYLALIHRLMLVVPTSVKGFALRRITCWNVRECKKIKEIWKALSICVNRQLNGVERPWMRPTIIRRRWSLHG
jgi:hypothetical protein